MHITRLHQLLHAVLQQVFEGIILPVTEPDLHTVIDLFLVGIRLVNHTNTRDVVLIVESLTNHTQHNRLPELGELLVIFLYDKYSDPPQLEKTTRIFPPFMFWGSSYFGSMPSLKMHCPKIYDATSSESLTLYFLGASSG